MVGLVDCNNFFVSCERIFEPSLEGRPVAVLSNNDGVVVARSKELKALNIPMGEPYFKLKQVAPLFGIVFKSSNYELYADISRRVMELLHQSAPLVEQYSIDEAFLFISLADESGYAPLAEALRAKILQWVGMPVGIGFAPTRTLAKIANHHAKKGTGVFVMLQVDRGLLAELPVEEVWGVGGRLAPRLRGIGIRSAAQLAEMDEKDARRRFGVCLVRTIYELNGVQAALPDSGPAQTTTCSRTFGTPVTELGELRESIAVYGGQAAAKMREMGRKASGCNVYFQYCPEYSPARLEGGWSGRSIVFRRSTNNSSELLQQIFPVLRGIFIPGRRYRKSGISFWGLEEQRLEQLNLFDKPAPPPIPDALYKAIDAINHDYGKKTIRPLAEGLEQPWAMRRNLLSRRYTTCWDEIPVVKC